MELGVVIGRTARGLDLPDEPLEHVAGYVLSHGSALDVDGGVTRLRIRARSA